ncbi:lysozyme inhibitor LprI family protein [Paraburkholderia fungorum]|uniref:lysozyme inhibitor LprI family protein n=1 Tax=Paraburkholderia fungorum TaxID=134537 RepID=UPI0038BB34CA
MAQVALEKPINQGRRLTDRKPLFLRQSLGTGCCLTNFRSAFTGRLATNIYFPGFKGELVRYADRIADAGPHRCWPSKYGTCRKVSTGVSLLRSGIGRRHILFQGFEMKSGVLLCVFIALGMATSSAYAIDCRKAASSVERLICAHKDLQNADAAMGEAYAKILAKAGSDTEIRVMLVRNQKRWISARDKGFDGTMDFPGAPDKGALAQSLLQAMRSRTAELTETSHANPALPHLIELASAQRKFLGQFTGGAFAGFDMSCDFLPGGGTLSYGCFGVRRYQNLDRVCMVQDDWASGHVSQVQSVANVVRGKLEEVAVCGDGEADAGQCPDAGNPADPTAQWNRHPAQSPGRTASSQNWPQLDTDADAGVALDWLRVCLTDSHYPPAQVAKQSGK